MTNEQNTATTDVTSGPRVWDPVAGVWISARRPPQAPGEPMQRPVRPIWSVDVVDVVDLTPHMRRVRLGGEALQHFRHEPSADFTIYIPQPEGDPIRRHYTARAFDPEAKVLDIDFVMHGEGPAVKWAATVQPGMRLDISGPHLRAELDPTADWYILAGDESAIPAIFGLVESLPASATAKVYIEVTDESEMQDLDSDATVHLHWLYRGDTPGDQSRELHDAVLEEGLPAGSGFVFLAGETNGMRELRKTLIERGLPREQIFAMGYWRPGRFGGDETIRD